MLIVINNLLSKQQVSNYCQQLQNAHWIDGKTTAGSLAAGIKSNLQLEDTDTLAMAIGQEVLQAISSHPSFISAALPKNIYPPKFNQYKNGGHYGTHVDNAIMTLPQSSHGAGQIMRTDLSATLFLTEPDQYQGGELCIETSYGAQQIKLDAGDLVLYPSSSLHQVLPVTEGARTSCFFWIESMVRDADQRSILFDLDQSIQQLTADLGQQNDEVKRLTGVYHNLIRQWAES